VNPLAFRTPAGATRRQRWLLYSPATRIALFSLLMALLLAATWGVVAALGWTAKDVARPFSRAAFLLRQVLPALAAYVLLVRWVERRAPEELTSRVLRGTACGLAGGTLLITSVMTGLWLFGAYQVTGFNAGAAWVGPLLLAGLGTAIAEEIVFRGVLLRISEEGLGSAAALGLSALLFGALHLGNPNATPWSSLAIALEAGVLLGLVYQVWRSLPVCIGVHLAWNFLEGTVFGSAVSGSMGKSSFIVGELRGPTWLSGGVFGIEASVLTVGISLAVSLVLFALARQRGHWVPFRPGRAPARQDAAADNGSIPASTPC
jgi:membrane protease YdiL (CAAX protease family)